MYKNRKRESDPVLDRQTMEELYEAYEQKMFVVAKAILGNDWQAEDAVHEAFVRMVKYLPRCQDIHSKKTKILIVRVIKSTAIDIYRKNRKEMINISTEENLWIEDRKNVIESYLASLSVEELMSEITERVPDMYKDVIRMRYYDGLPVQDIGRLLNISEDNVYQRLSRAKKMIKEIVGDELDVETKLG